MSKETPGSFVDPSFLRRFTSELKSFPAAVAALVKNSFDNGASSVTVEFYKERGCMNLRVIDDGRGMDEATRRAFVSIEFSAAATGEKRGGYGAGRFGFVHHAARMSVRTKHVDEDLAYSCSFTPDEFADALHDGAISFRSHRETGDFFNTHPNLMGTHGTVVTLHDLGRGEGVNRRQHRTPEVVIDQLAYHLSWHEASRVTVVDEDELEHELKPRSTKGDVISRRTENRPQLGDVGYIIAVLDKFRDRDDGILVNPDQMSGYTVKNLITQLWNAEFLTQNQLKDLLEILAHSQLAGVMEIPELAEWMLPTRDAFDTEILRANPETARAIVEFLFEDPLSKVEKALNADFRFLSESGTKIACGRSVTLSLVNVGRLAGEPVWDASACGGILEVAEDKKRAVYTAGSTPQKCSVVVTDSENPRRVARFDFETVKQDWPEALTPLNQIGRLIENRGQEIEFCGKRYQLTATELGSADDEMKLSILFPEDKPIIAVNYGHPSLAGRSDNEKRLLIIREISLRIAESETSNGSVAEILDRSALIYARLLGA